MLVCGNCGFKRCLCDKLSQTPQKLVCKDCGLTPCICSCSSCGFYYCICGKNPKTSRPKPVVKKSPIVKPIVLPTERFEVQRELEVEIILVQMRRKLRKGTLSLEDAQGILDRAETKQIIVKIPQTALPVRKVRF